jgi:predicted phosphohydrolase
MKIFAIADLHLAISIPEKTMEVFGGNWLRYQELIQENWPKVVSQEDIVLIAGDISWAMHWEEALIDLQWLDKLPGKKVLLKGNHDYWWPSKKKLETGLPPSFTFIHDKPLLINNIAIAGARLWDDPDCDCSDFFNYVPSEYVKEKERDLELDAKILQKELYRLEQNLAQMDGSAEVRICMTHYPPISSKLYPSRASELIERYKIDYCVFGHLHNIEPKRSVFGSHRGTEYIFVAGDYLGFTPKLIFG